MKNKLVLLFLIILGIGIIVLISLKFFNQTKTQTKIQQKDSNVISYQSQTDEKASVTIEATPLLLRGGDKTSFTVIFTTHSGDLNYDIVATSKLSDEKGNTYKALSWTGGKGGHHLSGVLSFPSISKEVKSVTLTIPQIDNKDRIFEWKLN